MVSDLVKILAEEALLTQLTLKLVDSPIGQVEGPDRENCCRDYAGDQVIVAEDGSGRVHETDDYACQAS